VLALGQALEEIFDFSSVAGLICDLCFDRCSKEEEKWIG
jgi:hypothetical protein